MTWGRIFGSFVGAATTGPVGVFIGGVVGDLAQALVQLSKETLEETLTNVSSDVLRDASMRVVGRLSPAERKRVNHDLQAAFRAGAREALADIGGPAVFAAAWRAGRDVPEPVVYAGARASGELAERIAHALRELDRAIERGEVLPLEPPVERPESSIYSYLADDRPLALAERFAAVCAEPFLDDQFASLMAEAPTLREHLRRFMLDRTLVHFGELLKGPEHEAAWRAFSRLMLEGTRDELRAIAEGQPALGQKLASSVDRLDMSAQSLAEMVALVGSLERQRDEQVASFLDRVVASHSAMQQRLQSLTSLVEHTDIKISWVVEVLRQNLSRGALTPESAPAEEGEPPFQGLQPFSEHDVDRFFGRELLTASLANRVAALHRSTSATRLLCVIGPSGSGKSSLVLAGLVPALRSGQPLADESLPPAGSEGWTYRAFKPSATPTKALADALADDMVGAQAGGRHARRLLVVDQLEELFTACKDEAERQRFVDRLLEVCGPAGNTVVVITLRADFYAACAPYPQLRELISRQQEYIGPLAGAELRRALEGPARHGAWFFEGGLVDLILRDVGGQPGALPLLSHALLETWKRRRGRTMTLESYAEAGGVHGAIARTADQTLAELTPGEQRIARGVFLRLTELGDNAPDTRRRVTMRELVLRAGDAPTVEGVVQRLTDARLVTTETVRRLVEGQWVLTGERTVEVAHEALIREWRTLRRWLDEDREGQLLHRRLTEDAQEWERLGRDQGALYRGSRLADVKEWAAHNPEELNEQEYAFLQASLEAVAQEEREREAARQRELAQARALADEQQRRAEEGEAYSRRLRSRLRLLRALFAVTLALGVAAGVLAYMANQQAAAAISSQLVAQTRALADDRDLALLLGVEASRRGDTPAAANALRGALQAAPNLRTFLHGHTEWVQAVALSSDGSWLASAGDDGRILLWARRGGTIDAEPRALRDEGPRVRSVAFTSDSRWLAAGDDAGQVVLFDLAGEAGQGRVLREAGPRVYGVAFSPADGTLAAGDSDGTVTIFDLEGAEAPRELRGHNQAIRAVAFSPRGDLLASSGDDSRIVLWDPATGERQGRALSDYPQEDTLNDDVVTLAFSPDGSALAAGGWDTTIKLWDVTRGALLRAPLEGHAAPVLSVAFNDAGTLVSSSVDRTVITWDLQRGLPAGPPLTGHTSWVTSVALSQDGSLLAAGSGDGSISLWDLATPSAFGRPIADLHTAAAFALAYSPDGRALASGGFDGSILLRDPVSGAVTGPPLKGHTGAIYNLVFSPSGSTLISGSSDGSIMLWNLAVGRPLARLFTDLTEPALRIAHHPDEPILASAHCSRINWQTKFCDQSDVYFWDTDTRQIVAHWPAIYAGVISLMSFSADGEQLILGGQFDPVLICGRADGGACEQLYTGNPGTLTSLALLPDGDTIATGSCAVLDQTTGCTRGEVAFHSLDTFLRARDPITYEGPFVTALAVDPTREHLVTGSQDGSLRFWDLATGRLVAGPVQAHTSFVQGLAFQHDGRRLISIGFDGRLKVWDGATHAQLDEQSSGHRAHVASVAVSPDGGTIATGGLDATISRWEPDGTRVATPIQANDWVRDLAYSPDGQLIAASIGSAVAIYTLPDGAPLASLSDQTTWVGKLAFSPDSAKVAAGGCAVMRGLQNCDMGEVLVWSRAATAPITLTQKLVGHAGSVTAVAFSPDGRTLASGATDGSIALWDLATGEQIAPPWSGHGQDVFDLTFSPDGRLLATSSRDTTIRLWDVQRRTLALPPLAGNNDSVFSIAFSADGQLLASGGADEIVRVWDTHSGDLVHLLRGHGNWVSDVAFTPDGRLVSVGRDTRAFVWDLSSRLAAWQEQACAMAGRNLTRAEWARFMAGRPYQVTCPQWPIPEERVPRAAPTVPPAPTPTAPAPLATGPTVTPADPTSAILYADDFGDATSGWSRITSAAARTSYGEDVYQIATYVEDYSSWGLAGINLRDADLEVQARRVRGDPGGIYGLILRATDSQHFYALMVTDRGGFAFMLNEGGTWKILVPWTVHEAIRTDGSGNTLRVVAEGDRFTLTINGTQVGEHRDPTYSSGDIGLLAGTVTGQRDMVITFDDVVARPVRSGRP